MRELQANWAPGSVNDPAFYEPSDRPIPYWLLAQQYKPTSGGRKVTGPSSGDVVLTIDAAGMGVVLGHF